MKESPVQPGIEVRIEGDAERARVIVGGGADPDRVTCESLERIVLKRGVDVTSATRAKLGEIARRFRQEPKLIDGVIVEAAPPRHGRDGGLEFVEGFDPTVPKRAAESHEDRGAVDHHLVNSFVAVSEGTHVAFLREAEAGEGGRDVFGKAIAARPGKTSGDVVDSETLLVGENGRVTAKISGVLRFEHGELKIDPVMEIKEHVDFSTGNIDFGGSVIIGEGIRDEFVVRARKDVTVGGLIEAATVICGGNLTCRRGMAAKDRGRLLVRGDARGVFFNNVRGWIDKSLHLERELTNCELVVVGDLDGPRSTIIGGRIIIAGRAKVGTLGSRVGVPTTVVLGTAPRLNRKLAKLTAFVERLRSKLEMEQERLEEIQSKSEDPMPGGASRADVLNGEIAKLEERLEKCRRERSRVLDELGRERVVDLHVNTMIHRGVRIVVGGREVVFRKRYRGPLRISGNAATGLTLQQGGSVQELRSVA